MVAPRTSVRDLLGRAEGVPPLQTRGAPGILLLCRVRLPPRLTPSVRIDTATAVTLGESTFQSGLRTDARAVETRLQQPQTLTTTLWGQSPPPLRVPLPQLLVRDLAFSFPPSTRSRSPRRALGRHMSAALGVVHVGTSGEGQRGRTRPGAVCVAGGEADVLEVCEDLTLSSDRVRGE